MNMRDFLHYTYNLEEYVRNIRKTGIQLYSGVGAIVFLLLKFLLHMKSKEVFLLRLYSVWILYFLENNGIVRCCWFSFIKMLLLDAALYLLLLVIVIFEIYKKVKRSLFVFCRQWDFITQQFFRLKYSCELNYLFNILLN